MNMAIFMALLMIPGVYTYLKTHQAIHNVYKYLNTYKHVHIHIFTNIYL